MMTGMTSDEVISYFKQEYPGKNIVMIPEDDPTELLCEIEPSAEHADYSVAIAAIKESKAHFHNIATETYELIKGSVELFIDGKGCVLRVGEKVTILPSQTHYAVGNFGLVKVSSRPGWTVDDHIIV